MSHPPSPRWSMLQMLPKEHGAWAFLLLPTVAGLLAAPSWAGALIALGALAAFLARGPFLAGRQGLHHLAGLATLAIVLFGTGAWKGGWVTASALLGAGLLGLPLMARSTREMRNLPSESLALLACGALLPAILGAGGATFAEAFRGWALIVLLALPPLVHLRHRLALGRKGEAPRLSRGALLVQLLAMALGFGLWSWHLVPGLIPVWTAALLLRGFWRSPASARSLGWTEAVVSLGHLGVLWISLTGL